MSTCSSPACARRIIEHRYGRVIPQLQQTAQMCLIDLRLPMLLHRYAELEQTEKAIAKACRSLRQRLNAGDSRAADHASLILGYAQHLHDLAVRRDIETDVVRVLLDGERWKDQPASPAGSTARAMASSAPGIEDLMPLARSIAAGLPRLSREALGSALRGYGIAVSNERVGAVLRRLRAEARSSAVA